MRATVSVFRESAKAGAIPRGVLSLDDQPCLSDPEPWLVPFMDLLPLRLARKDTAYTTLSIECQRDTGDGKSRTLTLAHD